MLLKQSKLHLLWIIVWEQVRYLLLNLDVEYTTAFSINIWKKFAEGLHSYLLSTSQQGFDKITDDLILKYGKDLILENDMEVASCKNRDAAKDFKLMQSNYKRGWIVLV